MSENNKAIGWQPATNDPVNAQIFNDAIMSRVMQTVRRLHILTAQVKLVEVEANLAKFNYRARADNPSFQTVVRIDPTVPN